MRYSVRELVANFVLKSRAASACRATRSACRRVTGDPGSVGNMSDTDVRIGERLQQLRGEMSQAALAAAMAERRHKWSQATVWSVESAKRPLRLAEAEDVADILGVTVADLLRRDGVEMASRAAAAEIEAVNAKVEALRHAVRDVEHARQRAGDAVQALGMLAGTGESMRARARYGMARKRYDAATAQSSVEIVRGVEDEMRAELARYSEEGHSGVDPEAS